MMNTADEKSISQKANERKRKSEAKKKKIINISKVLLMSVIVVVVLSLVISGLKSLFPGHSTLGQIGYTSVLDGPVRTPFENSVENNLLGMHLDREDPKPTPAPEIDINAVNFNDYGQKIVVGERAYDSFKFSDSEIQSIATSINSGVSMLGDEINVFAMVVPTSCGVMLPADYISDNYSKFTNQKTACDTINSLLDSNIAGLDIYSTLKANTDQKLYFNSENYWTGLGAYYAYTVWANRRGDEVYPLNGYEKHSVDGYAGYLYTFIGSKKVGAPEPVEFYEPTSMLNIDGKAIFTDVSEASATKKTNVFLGGESDQIIISNKSLSDDSVGIIVGDKSAYALVPYLAESYETTYFIDYRLYEGSLRSLISTSGAVDVSYCISIDSCLNSDEMDALAAIA